MENWVYCIIFWDLPVVYLQKALFYHCTDTQMEPALNPATFASWTQIKDFHTSLSKRWTIFCATQPALLYQDQSLSRNDVSHNIRSWPLTSQNISLFWLWVYAYFSCCDKQFWKHSAVPFVCHLQVIVLFVLYIRAGTMIWIAPSWRGTHKTTKSKKMGKIKEEADPQKHQHYVPKYYC